MPSLHQDYRLMICQKCGSPYEEGDIFCGNCGTRIEVHSEQPEAEAFVPLPEATRTRSRTNRKKRKSTRGPLKVFGIFILIVLLGTSLSGWFVLSRFASANSLSSVPAQVQLSLDESSESVDIDTAPALLALEQSNLNPKSYAAPMRSVATPQFGTPAASELQTPEPDVKDSEGITVLLMGVDAGSSEEIDVGVRPDSLSVLHLDPDTGTCRLLGIPRDSRVELPGYGLTKINHALAVGGIPYQRLVVQQFLGIEIDHYGLVDFEGVVGVVDAVGGITVNNPYAFDHLGFHFAEGEIQLDGEKALAYSRYRYGPDGDFGRIDRQQLVMRAVLSELGGMDAVRAVPSLLDAAEGHFKTDLSVLEMIGLANDFRTSCTASTLETRSLNGDNAMFADPMLNQDLWYVVVDAESVVDGVRWLREGE